EVERGADSLDDARTESSSRLIPRDESRKLSIECEAPHGENSSLLLRIHSKQLHIVFRLRAEVCHGRSGIERAANGRGKLVNRYVERHSRDGVAEWVEPLGDQLPSGIANEQ